MSENYAPGADALPVPPYTTVLLVCNSMCLNNACLRADVYDFSRKETWD